MDDNSVQSTQSNPTIGQKIKHVFRNENAVLGIVLVAVIAAMAGATKGLTASRGNAVNILLQSSVNGVASMGQTFVILSAGIDLSVGGIGLFASILGTKLMAEGWHNLTGNPIPVVAGIIIMIFVSAGWGSVNGTAISRIGMPPLIVTLAIWEITKGAAFQVSGGRSVAQQPDALAFIGSGTISGVPVPVIIFIIVAVISYFLLNHTTFGRQVYAVGGNPLSAWLSGINVKKIQLAVYTISGLLAGLSGAILTGRIMSASMQTLSGLELNTIAAVCIGGVSLAGGKGTLTGAVLGVIIIGVINNGMSVLGADPSLQGIVKGVIIFTAVAIDYIRRRR